MAAPALEKGEAGKGVPRPLLGQQHEAGAASGSWGLREGNRRLLRQQRGRGRRKKEETKEARGEPTGDDQGGRTWGFWGLRERHSTKHRCSESRGRGFETGESLPGIALLRAGRKIHPGFSTALAEPQKSIDSS